MGIFLLIVMSLLARGGTPCDIERLERTAMGAVLDHDEHSRMEERLRENATFRSSLEPYDNRVGDPDELSEDRCLCTATFRALNAQVGVADRSITPWKYLNNYDSRRDPDKRYLLDAACACDGCFYLDDAGRYVYTEKLKSRRIEYNDSVTVEGSRDDVLLHAGCFCVFPEGFDGPSDDGWLLY